MRHRLQPPNRDRLAGLFITCALTATAGCPRDQPSTPPRATSAPDDDEARDALTLDGQAMRRDLAHLASDELAGRYTLSPDLERAAAYIAGQYEAAGISPVGDGYLHPFPYVEGSRAAAPPTLTVTRGRRSRALDPEELRPRPEGTSGGAEGEVVFVGYAVRSAPASNDGGADDANAPVAKDPEPAYDDLAGVDLQGKIALLLLEAPGRPDLRAMFAWLSDRATAFEAAAAPLRAAGDTGALVHLHQDLRRDLGARIEPFLRGRKLPPKFYAAPKDPAAPLDLMVVLRPVMELARDLPGPDFAGGAGDLETKLARLQAAGAVGAIVVRGPRSYFDPAQRDAGALPDLAELRPPRAPAKIPVVQVRWQAADAALKVRGKKLSRLQAALDTTLRPRSGPTGLRARIEAATEPLTRPVPNVLATIPGSDLADEIVILGAHYDHIGTAERGMCRPARDDAGGAPDVICNGADDNASGTAMVLALARALAKTHPRRTLVFAHFAGEELGLHGSKALADAPPEFAPFAAGKVVAMINLDMVGRLGPKGLAVGGVGSSPAWMPLLEDIGNGGLKTLYDRAVAGRSDHASFYEHDIPVLFFFTGVHRDYHRATDHTEKIDFDGMDRIANIVGRVMLALGDGLAVPYRPPATAAEGLVPSLPGDDPDTVEKRVGKDGAPG